ncbi:MAG: hypothetical protein FJ086_17925 [Deltaproteobacteria bacterium]|nr:hypothetical protein [Deltaproteobacteria bacterium]
MAPSKRTEPAAPAALPAPSYPAIEGFVERASSADVEGAFASLSGPLAELKGPRAAQGKKVEAALARTQELLAHLVEVKERLEAERKGKRR